LTASVEVQAAVNSQRETIPIAILLVSFAFVACGGSSSSSGPPTEGAINLTPSGLSSAAVTIPSGGRIHFFNKDTIDHQIASSCSDLASPRLSPGGDSLRPQMTGPQSCTIGPGSSVTPFAGIGVTRVAGDFRVASDGYLLSSRTTNAGFTGGVRLFANQGIEAVAEWVVFPGRLVHPSFSLAWQTHL
jgi:hypothetical protein